MSFEGKVLAAAAEPGAENLKAGACWGLLALFAAATVVQQSIIGVDTDVSWLITVGEKVLNGQRLYIDIFEVNPPASVWIYLPAIALARLVGVSPELATVASVFLLAGFSFWGSAKILRSVEPIDREQQFPLLAGAGFTFLLLPGACFAQREHVAALALLPFIAACAARSRGAPVTRVAALLAGIGAGVTIAIKPHFALAVAPMVLFVMWRRRSVAAGVGAECWAAAAAALTYALAVAWLYPTFLSEALPLLKAVYIPARSSFAEVWLSPSGLLFFVAAGLAAFLLRRRAVRSLSMLPLLAAFGFAAALGVQGKGYLNHWYPALALTIFALVAIIAESGADRAERRFGGSVTIVLSGLAAFLFAQAQSYPELERLVRQVAPEHPKLIVAGSNLSVGHPLTRWVGGEWVGRRGALWATGTAVEVIERSNPGERTILQHYIDEDRRIFVEDVEGRRPDLILVPGEEGRHWIASNPDVARATSGYRVAGFAEGVTVLVR